MTRSSGVFSDCRSRWARSISTWNSGVSSRVARSQKPTGAMARPRMKGIRQPQLPTCSGLRNRVMQVATRAASTLEIAMLACSQEE